MNIFSWIRGAIRKMFSKNNIEDALSIEIAVSMEMELKIQRWGQMYKNEAPWINDDIKSLELPSAIANEFVRLTIAEFNSNITGGARASYIKNIYDSAIKELPNNLEYGNARGGLILKPYVKNNNIFVEFIQQGYFFPIEYDDTGKITGAVFVSQKTRGEDIFTRLEYHTLQGNNYFIINKAFKSKDKDDLGDEISLSQVEEWKNIQEKTEINNVEKPLFAYYKPPIANNIDVKSPLGVSVYAKAENLIKDADIQYGRIMWEYEASEKAIYASTEALRQRREKNGRSLWEIPKLKDRLFRAVDISKANGEEFFHDYSPEVRDEAFWRGFNKILERIEFNCMLAYGTLSEPTYSDKTATEIKASKQRSYVTISRMQENLQKALEDLLYAIDVLTTLYKLAPLGTYQASFEWGDSVLMDTEKEQLLQMQEVNAGVRSKLKYIMFRYGLTEEQALEELTRIQKEKMSNQEAFGFTSNQIEEE